MNLQEDLVSAGERLVLLGSRCDACAAFNFPRSERCKRCCTESIQPCELGDRGTLWSWTVQSFPPKAPYRGAQDEQFEPFGVGYIHMDNTDVLVESRILLDSDRPLTIGMPMRLYLETLCHDERGNAIETFAFQAEVTA